MRAAGRTKTRDMLTAFETIGDFALVLEYLAATVGADTPTQLLVIARALRAIPWNLPSPEPLTPDRSICGYGECVAHRAVTTKEISAERRLPHVRELFEPLPRQPAIKKICFLHEAAKVSPGYKLVAMHGENGTVAFVENDAVNETTARKFIRDGYSCVFVKQ